MWFQKDPDDNITDDGWKRNQARGKREVQGVFSINRQEVRRIWNKILTVRMDRSGGYKRLLKNVDITD